MYASTPLAEELQQRARGGDDATVPLSPVLHLCHTRCTRSAVHRGEVRGVRSALGVVRYSTRSESSVPSIARGTRTQISRTVFSPIVITCGGYTRLSDGTVPMISL